MVLPLLKLKADANAGVGLVDVGTHFVQSYDRALYDGEVWNGSPEGGREFTMVVSPLQRACLKKRSEALGREVVGYLLAYGANVNFKARRSEVTWYHTSEQYENQFTALHASSMHRDAGVIELLLQHGADISDVMAMGGNWGVWGDSATVSDVWPRLLSASALQAAMHYPSDSALRSPSEHATFCGCGGDFAVCCHNPGNYQNEVPRSVRVLQEWTDMCYGQRAVVRRWGWDYYRTGMVWTKRHHHRWPRELRCRLAMMICVLNGVSRQATLSDEVEEMLLCAVNRRWCEGEGAGAVMVS
jgi:hypothetical protein